MSNGILEPDHSKRNYTVFIIAILVLVATASFYFISNRGCKDYIEHLQSCAPYQCTQRVMGFNSDYLGHKAITIRREIKGLEKDKYFDTSTCNVVETDNISKDEKISCKYSDKTRKIVITRAAILFGMEMPPQSLEKPLTEVEIASLRASYAQRTPEQLNECRKD